MKISIFGLFLFVLTITDANAVWKDPVEYVAGEWSDSVTGFGLIESESSFEYPENYCSTNDGYFVIADSKNNRVKVYKDGVINKIIQSPIEDPDAYWPDILMCSGNTIITDDHKSKRVYKTNGDLIILPTDKDNIYVANDKYIATAIKGKSKLYDNSWNLIREDVVPLKEVGYADGNKVYINDKILSITNKNIDKFKIDNSFNLYLVDSLSENNSIHYEVVKYNKCGQVISYIKLPNDEVIDNEDGSLTRNNVVSSPYIANNGDIYEAIASDNDYRILKWEWIDTPVPVYTPIAPANPSIQVFDDAIRIIWDNTEQDPGCVSGYEVSRSEDPAGAFVKLTTVLPNAKLYYIYDDKAVVKGKRYYYKIRTVVDDLFSDYSVAINGIINP